MQEKKGWILSSIAAATLLLSGCGSDSDNNTENEKEPITKSVSIDFRAVLGQSDIVCSENNSTKLYSNVGTTNETVSFTDFRFFVSELSMVKADGTKVPLTLENNDFQYQAPNGDHTALLDFEDGTGDCTGRGNTAQTYTSIKASVPEGEYTDLEFTLGVPFDINHDKESYVEIKALNQPKMNWSWQAGRKFTKIELKPQSNPSLVWNFHLGSTGCEANEDTNSTVVTSECAQANRVKISLQNFDPQNNYVKVDYQSLLQHNDVSQDLGAAAGCMSALIDPECEAIMSNLGLDMSNQTGACINNGDCSSQKLFGVAAK